ncbi:hypothetical protein J6590_054647 [Homalodisca vitripennis]|nr:hypothetical protein J6590_054647 [Homalodisca vitripennis]
METLKQRPLSPTKVRRAERYVWPSILRALIEPSRCAWFSFYEVTDIEIGHVVGRTPSIYHTLTGFTTPKKKKKMVTSNPSS